MILVGIRIFAMTLINLFIYFFPASIEMIIWFLFFSLLICCITLIDLRIEESLHSWDKPHLIMVYDSFNVLLDSVC